VAYYWGQPVQSAGVQQEGEQLQQAKEEEQQQQRRQQQRQQCQLQARLRSMFAPVDARSAAAALGLRLPSGGGGDTAAAGDGGSCWQDDGAAADSCCAAWQSSAAVPGPSLDAWARGADDLGLLPEIQAVWWGLGAMQDVWGDAEAGSREAYRQAQRDACDLTAEAGRCQQLAQAYQGQQFTTPVVIGA
jgi:hypothetical protein